MLFLLKDIINLRLLSRDLVIKLIKQCVINETNEASEDLR